MTSRRAFTLIELLVVIAIIAILVALLLPAVQQVREAARKTQCSDHLHNVAVALHSYESSYKCFPIATEGINDLGNVAASKARWGWHARILSYVEQKPLYDSLNVGNVPFPAAGATGTDQVIEVYRCPSDTGPEKNNARGDYPLCNLIGSAGADWSYTNSNGATLTAVAQGMFESFRRVRFQDLTDGSSNTIAIGERMWEQKGVTTQPSAGIWLGQRDVNSPYTIRPVWDNVAYETGAYSINTTSGIRPSGAFSSKHPGGAQFALGDAKVTFISENVDSAAAMTAQPGVFQLLGQRNDGQPVKVP